MNNAEAQVVRGTRCSGRVNVPCLGTDTRRIKFIYDALQKALPTIDQFYTNEVYKGHASCVTMATTTISQNDKSVSMHSLKKHPTILLFCLIRSMTINIVMIFHWKAKIILISKIFFHMFYHIKYISF